MPPVFVFTDHYDATVSILGREVPLKIKRYPRADTDVLWQRSQDLRPRGTTELDADATAARASKTLAFFEEVITDAITLDEDVIVDRGTSIVDGAGLLELFHNRQDVLAALAAAVIIENRVMPSLAKNSKSPRVSDNGSEQSIPARGGDRQGPTVTSAAASTSAAAEAATDASSAAAGLPLESSGEASEAMAAGSR